MEDPGDTRGLIAGWLDLQDEAERPFARFDGEVPPETLVPAVLWQTTVAAPDTPMEKGAFDDFGVKARNLARAHDGQPEMMLVHAKLITLLRRRTPPPHATALFNQLWSHDPDRLAAALHPRWLISAAETMADHGQTAPQRATGLALSVLCKTVKIHETERLFSGQPPQALFSGTMKRHRLALDQAPFALLHGDADRVLFTRILRGAIGDPVAEALAWTLIPSLLADDRSVFRRLRHMRARRVTRSGD